jgi:hypothetical protein
MPSAPSFPGICKTGAANDPRSRAAVFSRKSVGVSSLWRGIRRAIPPCRQGLAAALHRRCSRIRATGVGQNRALFDCHRIRCLFIAASRRPRPCRRATGLRLFAGRRRRLRSRRSDDQRSHENCCGSAKHFHLHDRNSPSQFKSRKERAVMAMVPLRQGAYGGLPPFTRRCRVWISPETTFAAATCCSCRRWVICRPPASTG